MKKLLYISAALAGLTLASCKKQLQLDPYNALPPSEVFSDDADFQNAVNGMYQEMTHSFNYYDGGDNFNFIASNDILTDNVIGFHDARGSGETFSNWVYTPLTTTDFFQDGYAIIRSANEIIANIDNLPSTDANKSDFLGQALAIRAIVHFDMVRIFANAYTQASATDLGVPYVTSVQAYSDNPPRGLVKDNYDSIEVDLKNAAAIIGADASGRVGLAAVDGYLSRLYLDMADYADVITSATNSITLSPDPATIAEFPNIWTDETDAGVLFELVITQTDQLTPGTEYGQTTRAEYIPTAYLFNLYQSSDVRLNTYFTQVTYNNLTINLVTKYIGQPGGIANLVDIKLLRTAEVYLNRAEAYANSGNDALALQDLDMVRSNRYSPFTSGNETGQALKNAIALERRLELALEGDRFVDLKRRGQPIVRADIYGGLSSSLVRQWPSNALTMPVGDDRFAIPIDQPSITASKGVLVQNPGY